MKTSFYILKDYLLLYPQSINKMAARSPVCLYQVIGVHSNVLTDPHYGPPDPPVYKPPRFTPNAQQPGGWSFLFGALVEMTGE